jgi:hypothetical protein
MHPADLSNRLVPASRAGLRRQIRLDPRQTFALDHRADVVEHDACEYGRPQGAKQHGDETTARGPHQDDLR